MRHGWLRFAQLCRTLRQGRMTRRRRLCAILLPRTRHGRAPLQRSRLLCHCRRRRRRGCLLPRHRRLGRGRERSRQRRQAPLGQPCFDAPLVPPARRSHRGAPGRAVRRRGRGRRGCGGGGGRRGGAATYHIRRHCRRHCRVPAVVILAGADGGGGDGRRNVQSGRPCDSPLLPLPLPLLLLRGRPEHDGCSAALRFGPVRRARSATAIPRAMGRRWCDRG